MTRKDRQILYRDELFAKLSVNVDDDFLRASFYFQMQQKQGNAEKSQ